jgi:hypothetical protein
MWHEFVAVQVAVVPMVMLSTMEVPAIEIWSRDCR